MIKEFEDREHELNIVIIVIYSQIYIICLNTSNIDNELFFRKKSFEL